MAKKKQKKKEDKINIFKFLEAITYTKEDLTKDPLFEKSYDPFMINRWLSMSPKTIWAAFFCDQMKNLTKEQHFKWLKNFTDKQKVYLTYKGKKQSTKQEKILMDYYNIGLKQAREIINLLSEEQFKNIEEVFGGRK